MSEGQVVDRYRVERPLGEGGMAAVYLVRHTLLGSAHALKVLQRGGPRVWERLQREGRAQAQLRHPNLVAVTDQVTVGDAPGLILEYIPGPTLDEWLDRGLPSVAEAERLFRGILAGVEAAHQQGLVHRDLKPGNVLLDTVNGELVPKVADFGLVKVVEESELAVAPVAGETPLTRGPSAMGTPNYMAPEQVRDARDVDQRADIFALGCILYELLSGRRAFEGPDVYSVQENVVHGRFVPLAQRAPAAPERLLRTVEACLALDRAARPTDAATVRRLLDGLPAWEAAPTGPRREREEAEATLLPDEGEAPPEDAPRLAAVGATAVPPRGGTVLAGAAGAAAERGRPAGGAAASAPGPTPGPAPAGPGRREPGTPPASPTFPPPAETRWEELAAAGDEPREPASRPLPAPWTALGGPPGAAGEGTAEAAGPAGPPPTGPPPAEAAGPTGPLPAGPLPPGPLPASPVPPSPPRGPSPWTEAERAQDPPLPWAWVGGGLFAAGVFVAGLWFTWARGEADAGGPEGPAAPVAGPAAAPGGADPSTPPAPAPPAAGPGGSTAPVSAATNAAAASSPGPSSTSVGPAASAPAGAAAAPGAGAPASAGSPGGTAASPPGGASAGTQGGTAASPPGGASGAPAADSSASTSPGATGTLRLSSRPYATVTVDGAPCEGSCEVPAGRRTVSWSCQAASCAGERHSETLSVAPGQATTYCWDFTLDARCLGG